MHDHAAACPTLPAPVAVESGLVAWRPGKNGDPAYICRSTLQAIGSPYHEDVVQTYRPDEALVFHGEPGWDAFVDRVEAADHPLYCRLIRAGWRLAVKRVAVDFDAVIAGDRR